MPTLTTEDGTTINYTDHGGSGPNVLLVHGITEASQNWDPIASRLAGSARVVTMDLRGHGDSGTADAYDLGVMAGDVAALVAELGLTDVHLVGHSLGGAVVSAAGPAVAAKSVVNVDQSLALGEFKEMLGGFEDQLRDPEAFPLVMGGLFGQLMGEKLSADEKARINGIRRMDQTVVLGVWDLIFSMEVGQINEIIDASMAPYAADPVAYLALHGIDPGPDYGAWLAERIPGMVLEVWEDHGHYPHLVDPDRFVGRIQEFWALA